MLSTEIMGPFFDKEIAQSNDVKSVVVMEKRKEEKSVTNEERKKFDLIFHYSNFE